jgi:hypothetical protein
LPRDDPAVPPGFTRFLADSFELKTISDYGVDPEEIISAETAAATIETAARFIATIEDLLR